MLWKPRKGKIVSSWRNQERSPEKAAFESGLEGKGLFCGKEEIKKIKVLRPHILLTLSTQSLLVA